LLRIDQFIREILLAGKLDMVTGWVSVDKNRMDECCIPFCCDNVIAACICDTIRTRDRNHGQYPTRVYVKRKTAWEKVSGDAVLSVVAKGTNKIVLNPKFFGEEIVTVKVTSAGPGTVAYLD
jgi:hypothetical protein